jgi:hypothetical protein
MPAKATSVNLLEHDQSAESPIGRILNWATSYGRYIMITTEIVVILAFISRFSLDRKLTDLNETIAQKQAIIEANQPFEKDVLLIQSRLAEIKSLISSQNKFSDIILLFKSLIPPGVLVSSININPNQILLDVTASSTESFSEIINNFSQTPQFYDVNIGDISKDPSRGIQFKLTINLQTPTTLKTNVGKSDLPNSSGL